MLTNSPVRLACFKHAASVRPEPGSNSNVKILFSSNLEIIYILFDNMTLYVIY